MSFSSGERLSNSVGCRLFLIAGHQQPAKPTPQGSLPPFPILTPTTAEPLSPFEDRSAR